MAYFERTGALLSFAQLASEVQSHYISQSIKQAYVLLLGLDVLGNPYGLVKDFTQGLGDFFYEPFLVIILPAHDCGSRLCSDGQSVRFITNPKKGAHFDYFQGSIQSPDKFAENLARGVRSLFGHTVGQ